MSDHVRLAADWRGRLTFKSRMLLWAGKCGISRTDAISVSAGMKHLAFGGWREPRCPQQGPSRAHGSRSSRWHVVCLCWLLQDPPFPLPACGLGSIMLYCFSSQSSFLVLIQFPNCYAPKSAEAGALAAAALGNCLSAICQAVFVIKGG